MTLTRAQLARLGLGAWLTVMWVLLWGTPSLANLLAGVLVAAALLYVVPLPPSQGAPMHVRPVAVLSLVVWFSWELVVATFNVAVEVLRPPGRSRIRTGIVAIPVPGRSRGVVLLIANGISLTPGTLTVEVRGAEPTLYVHDIAVDDPETVRAAVRELERRVVLAFGSDEEIAEIRGLSATTTSPDGTEEATS